MVTKVFHRTHRAIKIYRVFQIITPINLNNKLSNQSFWDDVKYYMFNLSDYILRCLNEFEERWRRQR